MAVQANFLMTTTNVLMTTRVTSTFPVGLMAAGRSVDTRRS